MITKDDLIQQNKHWQHGFFQTPKKHRLVFQEILNQLDVDPLLLITGPRRVGKSVLLKQVINYLISQRKIKPEQILFFEFSSTNTLENLKQVFNLYHDHFADSTQRRFVFFDEIQYLEDYQDYIKLIYDAHKTKLKLFLTGSLSVDYKKQVQESLAGRYFNHKIYPLFFEEYLNLKNHPLYSRYLEVKKQPSQAKAMGLVSQLGAEFKDFLYFHRLPEAIDYDQKKSRLYTQTVKLQSLNQDALNYFTVKKPQLLTTLYEEIIKKNGAELSLRSLARKGFKTTHETLSKYLEILQAMSLIYVIYNTDRPIKRSKALKKAYTSSHLCFKNREFGFLIESYILERLLCQTGVGDKVTFYRDRQKEIDFLLPRQKVAIEVKYRSQIKLEQLAFLTQFSQKNNFQAQVVTFKKHSQNLFSQNIIATPAMLF